MKYCGAKVVLLSCILIHMIVPVIQVVSHMVQAGLLLLVVQGISYLSYPVLGWATDVYISRHKALKCSLISSTVANTMFFVIAAGFSVLMFTHVLHNDTAMVILLVLASLGVISLILTIGLYDANAIQFGMDQMLEATTQQLVAFIHWYYWCHVVGQLVIFYVTISALAFLSDYTYWSYLTFSVRNMAAIGSIVSLITLVTGVVALLCFLCSKKQFYILRAGINIFKTVHHVLSYSWKHEVPERRSAFTYWEEDIPPRIDLGKDKYGGPFTNEEVEDTKTFLRIFLLFITMFGYHLAGDGYSAPQQLQQTKCPSLPVLLLIIVNPTHLSTLVVLVGIPVYRFILRNGCNRWCPVRMLRRIWFGLLLSLIQVIIYIVLVSITPAHGNKFPHLTNYTVTGNCFYLLIDNQSCDPVTCLEDSTYLWFIIPQLLNGLSSLLVSMTALEFICAQAPHTTQGLLIGLWYATFSIRYLVVYVIDPFIIERTSWLIYEGVKGFLILVSLVLFSFVSRHYRYRQRDEIVNVQGIIEEIYERRMEQEKQYLEQCKYNNNYGAIFIRDQK